jgi:c(7)-type cytochrome triheme protein
MLVAIRKRLTGQALPAWALRLCLALVSGSALCQVQGPDRWRSLSDDHLHDPASPAIGVLQEPGEALSLMPPDVAGAGNQVNWVRALREGYIVPRAKVLEHTAVKVLDSEVLMMDTGEMPLVLFPHKPHTEWLDCSNCHEGIFKSKAGATPVNMFQILQGRYCGRCHGAVAFPLTECQRCHSVSRSKLKTR